MPSPIRARCSAIVPLHTAIPYLQPQYSANCRSNSLTNLPEEDIQPVETASVTYLSSLPASKGSQTGINAIAYYLIITIESSTGSNLTLSIVPQYGPCLISTISDG